MTSYVPGTGGLNSTLDVVELRVISNLIQAQSGNFSGSVDQLSTLRNDEAFGLGINPPIVPGN